MTTMFTQSDFAKLSQVRGMVEWHTDFPITVETKDDKAVFKWYTVDCNSEPFRQVEVNVDTVKNMDWSILTLLIMNG